MEIITFYCKALCSEEGRMSTGNMGKGLTALILLVITCFASSAWAESTKYMSSSLIKGFAKIAMATPSCDSSTSFFFVNGTTPAKEPFVMDSTFPAGSYPYFMKPGLWKIDVKNNNFNQTLTVYITVSGTEDGGEWVFAKGCSSALSPLPPNCSAASFFPAPGSSLNIGCQGQKYTPPAAPSGTPDEYWTMKKTDGFTGMTMALGKCNATVANGTVIDTTTTATYSVITDNNNATRKEFTVSNKDQRSMIVYMKQNTIWRIDVENSYFKQKQTTYVTITPNGWQYAYGCSANSREYYCTAGNRFGTPSANSKTLSPGCQEKSFSPI